jgi:hypothetical protein
MDDAAELVRRKEVETAATEEAMDWIGLDEEALICC